eukprot:365917-Chlamydomonas_euryale.AAC.10
MRPDLAFNDFSRARDPPWFASHRTTCLTSPQKACPSPVLLQAIQQLSGCWHQIACPGGEVGAGWTGGTGSTGVCTHDAADAGSQSSSMRADNCGNDVHLSRHDNCVSRRPRECRRAQQLPRRRHACSCDEDSASASPSLVSALALSDSSDRYACITEPLGAVERKLAT